MRDLERELLLDSLPGMAYRCDVKPPWAMQYVSAGVRFVTSYTREDFVSGRIAWGHLIHQDHIEEIQAELEAALSEQRHFTFLYRINDPIIGIRWINEAGQGIYGADGGPEALVGFIIDVTEHADVQQRLRAAEQRYALAAKATGEIIWDRELDTDRVRRIVPNDSSFLEHAPDVYCSLKWWEDRVHPEDAVRVHGSLNDLMANGGSHWSAEYRLMRPDGSYAYIFDQGFLVPTTGAGPRRMVGAMQDVSERKAAEAQVEQLQAELIHLSQGAAMNAMAATLAHELNQPLAAAANYLTGSRKLAAKELGEASGVMSGLKEAEQQIQRAGEIIRRMRKLVAREESRRELVELKKLVERVRKVATASGGCPKLRMRKMISRGAEFIVCDQIQIEQVMLNLIRNACEAMVHLDDPEIFISAVRSSDNFVEIQVSDNGTGLAEDAAANLFTAYCDSTSGGLGVGLSISRTIIEAHGGKIWAENNQKGGATFHLLLPAATEQSTA